MANKSQMKGKKRKNKEKNNLKTINKMSESTIFLVIALSVNELNSPLKDID